MQILCSPINKDHSASFSSAETQKGLSHLLDTYLPDSCRGSCLNMTHSLSDTDTGCLFKLLEADEQILSVNKMPKSLF